MAASGPKTTAGLIAMRNLQAQIEGHLSRPSASVADRITVVELLLLQGHVCSSVADRERAAVLADRLVRDAPTSGPAFLVRAQSRGAFHLFSEAFDDLDRARRLGADLNAVRSERAVTLDAFGGFDEAFELRYQAVTEQATFESVGALAASYASLGDCDQAERAFNDSRRRYRGVSPFPLAMLNFQHGHLWLAAGEPARARIWFADAVALLPAYTPAQGHLAQVEATLGDTESAVARLRPLAASCDDPDYAAQLAQILADAGHDCASQSWRARAASRYDELVDLHPEAFADHAAMFWLWRNTDPERAVRLAEINLQQRDTPRARALLARAIAACRPAIRRHGSQRDSSRYS